MLPVPVEFMPMQSRRVRNTFRSESSFRADGVERTIIIVGGRFRRLGSDATHREPPDPERIRELLARELGGWNVRQRQADDQLVRLRFELESPDGAGAVAVLGNPAEPDTLYGLFYAQRGQGVSRATVGPEFVGVLRGHGWQGGPPAGGPGRSPDLLGPPLDRQ
jgi:hypothetical protein